MSSNVSAPRSWDSYILKYEEGSNFVASAEQATADLQSALNSGDYNKIEAAINEINNLAGSPDFSAEYADLDQASLSNFLTGMGDTLNTKVLTQYNILVNGNPVGNLTVDPAKQVNARIVSNRSGYYPFYDTPHFPGMPAGSDFYNQLENAVQNCYSAYTDYEGLTTYCSGEIKFPYNQGGIVYDVDVQGICDGGGWCDSPPDIQVNITAQGTISQFAAQGMVSIQTNKGATGTDALTSFINSF